MKSTRLPGKPLLKHKQSNDLTIVEYMLDVANTCGISGMIYVLSDDDEVLKVVGDQGLQTEPTWCGCARINEAIRKLDIPANDLVINLQVDEIDISPGVLNDLNNKPGITTVGYRYKDMEIDNYKKDVVKAVYKRNKVGKYEVLWFSRDVMPSMTNNFSYCIHGGVYAMEANKYSVFEKRPEPTDAESVYDLEQFRILGSKDDFNIIILDRDDTPIALNTERDYQTWLNR